MTAAPAAAVTAVFAVGGRDEEGKRLRFPPALRLRPPVRVRPAAAPPNSAPGDTILPRSLFLRRQHSLRAQQSDAPFSLPPSLPPSVTGFPYRGFLNGAPRFPTPMGTSAAVHACAFSVLRASPRTTGLLRNRGSKTIANAGRCLP